MTKLKIQELNTPSAVVDIAKVDENISSMATRAEEGGIDLRPHIKTHKCIEIGKMQRRAGAIGVTVSTLEEAAVFADAGFEDITYAVPLAPNKFEAVRWISELTHLNVLVDHPAVVDKLGTFCGEAKSSLDVLVKVDCGYPRCGVDPETPAAIHLVKKIVENPNLQFKGILTHAGHSYDATSVSEIKRVAEQEQKVMVKFASTLKTERFTPEVVSIGSTPTVRLADSFHKEITEIRPGNYVFFDYTQVALGVCEVNECALTVLSSVISKNNDRIISDAGATALSKDTGPTHIDSSAGYGKIFQNYKQGLLETDFVIKSLSQEHGKILLQKDMTDSFEIGDVVRILPNHSCLTANLFDNYHVVEENSVLEEWKIHRGRIT